VKLSLSLATAMAFIVVSVVPAAAQTRGTEQACPPADVPDAQYTDTSRSVHREAIDCLVWWTIDVFGGSGSYQPGRALTRAEHAGLLSNLLDATGLDELGDTSDQGFEDIDGHRYERQINRLASLDVLNGKSATEFDPEGLIRRDQMASLIVQLHQRVYGEAIEPGSGFSDTDGNTHEDNIRRLVAAGITSGKTDDSYEPGGRVTREQIASFTMRHVGLLVELGHARTPNDFDTITLSGAGDDIVDVEIPANTLAIATLTHNGDSNFTVWTYNDAGENQNLVANEIGNYEGASEVNFEFNREVAGFDITADGAWSIVINPASDARAIGASGGSGAGDDVVTVDALAGEAVDLTHDGESNFVIWAYDADGEATGLVVNEIGAYQGTRRIPAGTRWLEVQADGAWTISPST
jgi:hypothetical protein